MTIFISHRGNTECIDEERENTPEYIDLAIQKGYEVEIDIWKIEDKLYLGHDEPELEVALEWLADRKKHLWIHTKNRQALEYLTEISQSFKFFWHSSEPYILTSNGLIWAHEYEEVDNDSLCIVPLLSLEQVEQSSVRDWFAVCTDYPDICKEKWNTKDNN